MWVSKAGSMIPDNGEYTGNTLLGKQPCWLSREVPRQDHSPHVFRHCLLVLQSLGHIWNSNGKPLIWKVCQSLGVALSSALVLIRFKAAFVIQSISKQRHNPYREWKPSFPAFPSRKWYPKLAEPRQSVEGPRGREVTPLVSGFSWEVPAPGNLSSCTFCGVSTAAPQLLPEMITLLTLHNEVPSIAPEVV